MMARKSIWILCMILAVVWLLHILYFVFRVKTITKQEAEEFEKEEVPAEK